MTFIYIQLSRSDEETWTIAEKSPFSSCLWSFWHAFNLEDQRILLHTSSTYSRLDEWHFTCQTTRILICSVLSALVRLQIKWLLFEMKSRNLRRFLSSSRLLCCIRISYFFKLLLSFPCSVSVHVADCGVFVQIGLQLRSIHVFDCFSRRGGSCWHQLLLVELRAQNWTWSVAASDMERCWHLKAESSRS